VSDKFSADRVMPQFVGMEQSAGPGADRSKSEPVRILIDATGPPVLNPAAAGVLLRILLRAAERDGMTNVTRAGNCPVLSDS
jgi:hypothetical protein